MNNYKIYLLIIFLIILVFTINLILKKINIKSYLKYLLISFFISYFFVLFNPRTKFLFNMTYLKAIILFISLFFFLFSYGIYKNNLKTYNKNIICYIIFYLILLFSITMVIKRVDMSFKLSNIKYLKGGNLIPFKSIKNYLKSNVLTRTKYLNIFFPRFLGFFSSLLKFSINSPSFLHKLIYIIQISLYLRKTTTHNKSNEL